MSYTAKVIAVLGRTIRAGRWKLADDSLVIAVFGRCVLDLSRAYVDEDDEDLNMSVFCLFGSVSVLLPPGCDVEPSGIAILASSEVEIPSDKHDDVTENVLAPLDISWFAMFGRVRINELSLGAEVALQVDEAVTAPPIEPPHTADPDPEAEAAQAAELAAQAAAEAESEQAALRDEIAQWRTETGRPEPEKQPADEDSPLEEVS